jgi:hypothetical protein
MSNETRDSATFLLKASDMSGVAGGINIKIIHLHICQRTDCKSLIVIAHEPGGKSYDMFKGDVAEIFNQILEVGQIGLVVIHAARRAFGNDWNSSSPGSGDVHDTHPAIGDCFVLKKVNNHLAVCDGHVQKDIIVRWLNYFMPERFLVLGADFQEVPVGAHGGGLWGWHHLEVHGGGLGP